MIELRNITREAFDRGLRVARAPFDRAAQLLIRQGGRRDVASLYIDRADAAVRAAVGSLFGDDDLREDAASRRVAADERARALALRKEAAESQLSADDVLAQQLDEAARLREEAELEARRRLDDVDAERAKRERRAEQAAAAQARAADQARREELEAVDRKAKRERMIVLDEEAAALDREADALTANDEAQRLRDAAATAKSDRKGTA
jgi:hypothetical protein